MHLGADGSKARALDSHSRGAVRFAHRQHDAGGDGQDAAGHDEERRLEADVAHEEEHAGAANQLPDRRAREHHPVHRAAFALVQGVAGEGVDCDVLHGAEGIVHEQHDGEEPQLVREPEQGG